MIMDILYIDYSKNMFVVDLKKSLCCNWLAKHMNVQKINTKWWQPKHHSKVCYERNNSELRLMTLISLIPNCAVSSCAMRSVKLMFWLTFLIPRLIVRELLFDPEALWITIWLIIEIRNLIWCTGRQQSEQLASTALQRNIWWCLFL